ncbi:hypothetical protein AXW83_14940 [Bosea sp. PAMC 26642]|nr:hypothetical protein AXW83_14940 [Bosea sp. PAMC 26642]
MVRDWLWFLTHRPGEPIDMRLLQMTLMGIARPRAGPERPNVCAAKFAARAFADMSTCDCRVERCHRVDRLNDETSISRVGPVKCLCQCRECSGIDRR